MSRYIPDFHFVNPEEKLTREWCRRAVNALYYMNNNISLLEGKNVKEIDSYADGNFDMTPFKRQFKSMRKRLENAPKNPDGSLSDWANSINTIGIDFAPLPLIPIKLNSAINQLMRIPVDPMVVSMDALAMKKKKEDIEFLKKKPEIENDLQELADEMGIGKVDIGTTKNSSVKFSSAPMGINLNDPEQEDIFSKLFYSLQVDTAFEKALKQIYSLKGSEQIRLLLVKDHLKYGVAVHRGYESSMTGLPDHDYIDPSAVRGPRSKLPDYSDQTHRIIDYSFTPLELFNYFSEEICDYNQLESILNDDKEGYCSCNQKFGAPASIDTNSWDTFRLSVKYIEVKSVDWIGIKRKVKSKRGVTMFTMNEEECHSKIWGQNTYGFYWLVNTNYFFGIHRLSGSHRTKGKESFQNFSTHIYKSQEKSAVELSIPENKKAQIAELKLQHTIIKSLPPGKYIDLKYLRAAMEGLVEEGSKYTMDDMLSMIFEHNFMLGDSEDFDGKNDGQQRPFIDIPGGLKNEAQGYMDVISRASFNIASITGINEQLTGQSAEELVGLQQLRINSGLNAIDYCNQAMKNQFEALYNTWALLIQNAIEDGGKTKQAIINMIGIEDTELLDALDESPMHEITARIDAGNNVKRMQSFQTQLDFLKSKNIVTTVDEYLLDAIDNPREKFQKLYFIEQRWMKEQDRIRQEQYQNAQNLESTRGENQMNVVNAQGEQRMKEIYAKGDVQAKITQLANQLGLSKIQTDGLIKRIIQKERNDGQTQKQIAALREKAALDNQKAYA